MTSPTQGEHAQTALQPIQRFEVVDCIDSKHVPAVIPNASGPWVRYEDHAAQVAALTPAQPAAPQGVAYAELPTPESYLFQHDETGLTQFVDAQQVEWGFQQNNPRLRRIGGAYTADQMRDFADRTHALRASNGQAPAGAADEMAINRPVEDSALPFNQWRGEMQSALKRAGVYAARSPGAGNKLTLRWRATRDDVLPTPTAQAAPAAGAVAGPDGRMSHELRRMIEGMSVSVDVSTGDHDAGHRYFGTVTEVMDCNGDKHGVTLLVQDAEPNFAPTPAAQADSVLEDADRWRMAVLVGKEVMLHPEKRTHANAVKAYIDAVHSGLDLTGAVDAARKQGGA